MKPTIGHTTKEKAHSLIDNHNGMNERVIVSHGTKANNYIDTHKCILWSDWVEETDAYGNKSPNRYVINQFYWQERTPDCILKQYYRYERK